MTALPRAPPSVPQCRPSIPAIHRVLVATDMPEVFPNVLRHACSLLHGGGAMHLVHVCATAICEAAEHKGADVICMGAKGHSRAGAALLGSTVQEVIARAHQPVFVVTPPLA